MRRASRKEKKGRGKKVIALLAPTKKDARRRSRLWAVVKTGEEKKKEKKRILRRLAIARSRKRKERKKDARLGRYDSRKSLRVVASPGRERKKKGQDCVCFARKGKSSMPSPGLVRLLEEKSSCHQKKKKKKGKGALTLDCALPSHANQGGKKTDPAQKLSPTSREEKSAVRRSPKRERKRDSTSTRTKRITSWSPTSSKDPPAEKAPGHHRDPRDSEEKKKEPSDLFASEKKGGGKKQQKEKNPFPSISRYEKDASRSFYFKHDELPGEKEGRKGRLRLRIEKRGKKRFGFLLGVREDATERRGFDLHPLKPRKKRRGEGTRRIPRSCASQKGGKKKREERL